MSLETELGRLERQVLGAVRVRGFADAVAELRRLLARESPDVRARVLKLTAPAIGRDLAAAVASAFNLGISAALDQVDGTPRGIPRDPPKALVAAALLAERNLAADLAKARKLAKVGADAATVMAPVNAAAVALERVTTTLVNSAGNAGATAVARAAQRPTVWVAEVNACVTCLAYSGRYVAPGDAFPAGLSYGRRSTVAEPIDYPPAHPNCRCTVEVLNDSSYAAALRREADRSVLRGFSLESESMATRVDAAERLIADGVDAPKSVIAYAKRAVNAGEFPTRGRP
jgi:hypothetical protein